MKIIKENIANLERCIENDKVDAVGSMPITMADAFYASQKYDKRLEDAIEESNDAPELEKVVGAEKQPVPKMPEEPKVTLEESLFEDFIDDDDKETLQEKKWDYELKAGTALRKAIDAEDYAEIQKQLINCYKELYEILPDFDIDDVEDKIEDITILDTDESEVDSIEDLEDSWNYELSDFYDFCDAYNVWIPLNESLSKRFVNRSLNEDTGYQNFLKMKKANGMEDETDEEADARYAKMGMGPIARKKTMCAKHGLDYNDETGKCDKKLHEWAGDELTGDEIIDDLAERAKLIMNDGIDLEDAISQALDDGLIYTSDIRVLANHYDVLPSDGELIDSFYENLYNDVYSKCAQYADGGEVEESLNEAKQGPKAAALVDSQGNVYTDEDRATDDMDDSTKNLWTVVYNEISPEHRNWMKKSKFKDVPFSKRYALEQVVPTYDDNLEITVDSEDELDFAKEVAEEYGLELKNIHPYKDKVVAILTMPQA